ncbi:MAG: thiamine diphosphokinase, partial [Agathobacter sp.]|nr:thiamine diphosphokinase [Agathobacter sp.]
MRTIIVSGGTVCEEFALEWLRSHAYDCTIAVDKGMEFFFHQNLVPDYMMGDYDSAPTEVLEHFSHQDKVKIITLNPIKDDTDTEFALRQAIAMGASEITILGATGSRLDHVLGNIELLGIGLQEEVVIEMVDPHNRIRMIDKECVIAREGQFGQYVSILPVTPQVKGLTLEGFRYPLRDDTLEKFTSLGISNEIEEDYGRITMKEGIV